MFVGEFLCCVPLLWTQLSRSKGDSAIASVLRRIGLHKSSNEGYSPVGQTEDEEEDAEEEELDNALTGWRMLWMWFPAFFDSECIMVTRLMVVCGTTLMNVGLILTPVSIYQMSRGALVLWVGILSVMFLRRHLWLYQWTALMIVTLGVCLVGLSGSLVKKAVNEGPIDGLIRIATSDDDPAKVALGVILILFAQNFTACQYVVEEKIMTRYKVEPLVSSSSQTQLISGRRNSGRILWTRHYPHRYAYPPLLFQRPLSLL
jgi:hypothetical protein